MWPTLEKHVHVQRKAASTNTIESIILKVVKDNYTLEEDGLLVCLSWNFVAETCKQRPKTPKLPGVDLLCCKKLGTSHDVKGFAIGSVLESIVVERANDDLCLKNI